MAHRKILEQDESELEIIAEAELSKLKKQYRTMEKERVAYVEDARLQLRSQQNIIDRLEFEKAELILAIRSAKSDTNVKREEILTAKLRQVLNQREKYIEMIKNEKQQIADLQEQIFKVYIINLTLGLLIFKCIYYTGVQGNSRHKETSAHRYAN